MPLKRSELLFFSGEFCGSLGSLQDLRKRKTIKKEVVKVVDYF